MLSAWSLWLAGAILLVLADLFFFGGASGVLLAAAGMALIGMGAALVGLSWEVQILSAAVSGVVLIPMALTLLRRWTPGRLSQGLDDPRLQGQTFRIHLDADGNPRVDIFGDEFGARPLAPGTPLEYGTPVRLARFEGTTAVVTREDEGW
ncbi:MAG: NfeD family protein [Halorhodospira sp.]